MGTLAVDSESVDADVYFTLGLLPCKASRKVEPLPVKSPRVVSLVSSFFERCVQRNDKRLESMETKQEATVFHGTRAPTISIKQYLKRIFKYSGCSPSCFVVAKVYVDRFLKQNDANLTSLNVHRLLITSIMLAAKVLDDAFFNNAYYARVGGVSTKELNRLEMKLLFSLDFRLQVSVKSFHSHCSRLEKEAGENLQIERPIQACRAKETWPGQADSACAQPIAR